MIELSGLRRYVTDDNTARLEADIKFVDMNVEAPADTLWFEMDANYGGMLVDDTYDPFMLVAMYVAMFHHTDLTIRGNVSKKLYKNLTWYAQKILCDFQSDLAPVKISVEGFAPTEVKGNLIGTGISCGVDSLSTIYDRFVREDDPDYRVNALFFFNCGSNGGADDDFTPAFANNRLKRGIAVASELGLPLVPIDTNLHKLWRHEYGDTLFFLSTYACVLALQNAVRRYYMGSGCSYTQIKACGVKYGVYDLVSYCESYFVPLIKTERVELIPDGCQYRRADKIKNIADWDVAQKYLNVCNYYNPVSDVPNCGRCEKCMRTLLVLEILGKLDDFANLFDLDAYKQASLKYKAEIVRNAETDAFSKEITDLATEFNFPMPTRKDCYVLGTNVMVINDK